MATSFHRRYLTIVEQIERRFPVAQWKAGDLDVWPLARMDLYLDMYWDAVQGAPPVMRWLPLRIAAWIAAPLRWLWHSRHDLAHWVGRPRAAHAVLLGDGVSLDRLTRGTVDRFGEPVMAALEKRGYTTFLMQFSNFSRLPWLRPTYSANITASRGALHALTCRLPVELPAHAQVLQFLAGENIVAPSLAADKLTRRARLVAATAHQFQKILRIVKPKLAFVVTYYAGLGPAFLLACRREGVLSIDLQHCPQGGAHKAYYWQGVPSNGYSILPAVFWNWTERDSTDIRRWTDGMKIPWHRSVHGGHTQLAAFLNDAHPTTQEWDRKFAEFGKQGFEREILVALQPVGGFRSEWEALARQIQAAPASWRWWIRRHPASTVQQDLEYPHLLQLQGANVIVDAALSWPLPTLLRHADVVVSRFSGAAAEGAAFGVPALFLSEEARGQYWDLIDGGFAAVTSVETLNASIAQLPNRPTRPMSVNQPDLNKILLELEIMSDEYAALKTRAT